MIRKLSDRLLERVVPKATAEASTSGCVYREIRCWYDNERVGRIYWDWQRDMSCGCWLP